MLHVDVKFASLLSPFLRNYKRKGEYLWNFSCPVCGDSSKNKLKARGYIFNVKSRLVVKCHNCGYSDGIGNFIKYVNPNLHQEYVYDTYKNNGVRQLIDDIPDIFKTCSKPTINNLSGLKTIESLSHDHPVYKYCLDRKIPLKYFGLLYYAPKFVQYYNSVNAQVIAAKEHPRLIIPFFDENGVCFAVQGRSFGKEIPKYYTIKFDKEKDKIFGLDRVDRSKRIYILEGPIDSLFIDNSIAVSGSSFNSKLIDEIKDNSTIVYDNEPRSPTIVKLIEKSIDNQYNVCIWPDTIKFKDINDMVINGISPEEIQIIIDSNTFSGLTAKVRLQHWRKC